MEIENSIHRPQIGKRPKKIKCGDIQTLVSDNRISYRVAFDAGDINDNGTIDQVLPWVLIWLQLKHIVTHKTEHTAKKYNFKSLRWLFIIWIQI